MSIAQASIARASTAPAAPAYPDLSGRVSELEQQLARAQADLSAVGPAKADTTALNERLAATEDRLATALRGYALLEKERDALQAKAAEASQAVVAEKDSLAAQVATLSGEVERLRAAAAGQTEANATVATLSTERDTLAARLTQVEAAAASAQAEAARLGESLAALQRSTGQANTEVAAARALVQQMQGANAVLAQENYQLKTMLSRTAGASAPVAATPVSAPLRTPAAPAATAPAQPPGARTHTVVAGDSLSRISQRYYGAANRWQEIYNANVDKLGPNGVLRVGTELRIP